MTRRVSHAALSNIETRHSSPVQNRIYIHRHTSLLRMPLPQNIRPMNPIQQPNGPIVQIELLMMKIMVLGLIMEEIIATMHSSSIEQLPRQKDPKGQDMAVEELRRQRNWQGVGEDLLEWVCELRRKGDWRCEFVVFLVDSSVQEWDV